MILEIIPSIPPKIVATRSNLKKPISPQLIAPMSTRINAAFDNFFNFNPPKISLYK